MIWKLRISHLPIYYGISVLEERVRVQRRSVAKLNTAIHLPEHENEIQ